jgi:hypothetical protein
MSETANVENLLASGGAVRLQRRQAQDVLQKLRARGAGSDAADRLESRLAHSDEVVLAPEEAVALLEELRASGRRWVFGSDAERQRPIPRVAAPEPVPAPTPGPRRGFRRLWRR